ncbi:MAG: hypothetical protein QME66_05765 [Candidatus Eisenbacteria bacterium]|nr:hypothetical protein [Candidatus Eisenbacteria bacterium]
MEITAPQIIQSNQNTPLNSAPNPAAQTDEAQAAVQTQQYYQQPPQQVQGTQLGQRFNPQAQYVPYERFQEVVGQANEYKQKLEEYQKSGQTEDASGADTEYWKNPRGYTDSKIEETQKNMNYFVQDEIDYRTTLGRVRSIQGYNDQIEEQLVSAIKTYNLASAGRGNAIRAAYRMVTGNELDRSASTVQAADSVKDRLARPAMTSPSGSGSGMSMDDFKKIPLDEFAKDPKGYSMKMLESSQQEGG